MSGNPRLMRTKLLLGEDGVRRLENACVMVIGLGAVGGYALEAVARAGVGKLILVDFDSFDETNINRQILALSSTVGRKKTARLIPIARLWLKICLSTAAICRNFWL